MSDEKKKTEEEFLDSAGEVLNAPKKPTEEEAQKEVTALTMEEQHRRQWCINMALQAWNLETSENNFIRVADKIYDYVYGKRPL